MVLFLPKGRRLLLVEMCRVRLIVACITVDRWWGWPRPDCPRAGREGDLRPARPFARRLVLVAVLRFARPCWRCCCAAAAPAL
eukprot:9372011-Alexandrium_andersonii.AAC.1